MFGGPWELVIVALIALLLFGKRLPEVARSVGKGLSEFKKGINDVQDEVNDATYS
ncbi:MAG: twin-arginine translocase TatA/TatE family subunit [Planctomycetaceae bacterium]|nr:twin-arginine translocase TatA/TatE family subunit [Planctomycetaceae bacterium]